LVGAWAFIRVHENHIAFNLKQHVLSFIILRSLTYFKNSPLT